MPAGSRSRARGPSQCQCDAGAYTNLQTKLIVFIMPVKAPFGESAHRSLDAENASDQEDKSNVPEIRHGRRAGRKGGRYAVKRPDPNR